MDNIEEIWVSLLSHGYNYDVSNYGNIRNINSGKILKNNINKYGYSYVIIHDKNIKCHQLVAIGFLGHKPDGTTKIVVDHINNNRSDNRLQNLQLISNRENIARSKTNKTGYRGVSNHYGDKFKAYININKVHYTIGIFETAKEASEAYIYAVNNPHLVFKTKRTSEYKYIYFDKNKNKWGVKYNGKPLGMYDTELLAKEFIDKYINGDITYEYKVKTSKYEGVYKSKNRWKVQYKGVYMGNFETEDLAYNKILEQTNK